MEVPISVDYGNMLKTGRSVTLVDLNGEKKYSGKITRVNGSIDQSTQSITTSIEVRSPNLKEGMYLEAKIEAQEAKNAISIDRSLLQEGNMVFVVKDGMLDLAPVKPVHFSDKKVVIQGLKDGQLIVNKSVAEAYAGMLVKVQKDTSPVVEVN